jgi:hypothetical protein
MLLLVEVINWRRRTVSDSFKIEPSRVHQVESVCQGGWGLRRTTLTGIVKYRKIFSLKNVWIGAERQSRIS